MNTISNTEFLLLILIAESGELSGYQINQLISERGMREWAGIGTTSIYNGLKKLEKRDLLASRIARDKTGKGPLPRNYKIVDSAYPVLRQEILDALSAAGNTERFDLALSALPMVERNSAIEAIHTRKSRIESKLNEVREKFRAQGGDQLAFHVRELFHHSFLRMMNEIHFLDELIGKYHKDS